MEYNESKSKLRQYIPIATAIAQTFGKNCEVVLHDTSDLEHSIIMIINGHITDRKIGGSITDYGLYFLKSELFKDKDYVANYQTESNDGKILKSTTVFIRDKQRKIIGFLCINYAIESFLETQETLSDFIKINKNINEIRTNKDTNGELFANDIDDLLNILFKKAKDEVGKPLGKLKKEDKVKIVKYLKKRGVFLVKGNIDKIAKKLNISRYTVYNYLSEIKYSADDELF